VFPSAKTTGNGVILLLRTAFRVQDASSAMVHINPNTIVTLVGAARLTPKPILLV